MKKDYSRSLQMLCPTCGCNQFEQQGCNDQLVCADCGLTITRGDLQASNGERINAALKAQKREVFRDMQKDWKKMLGKFGK